MLNLNQLVATRVRETAGTRHKARDIAEWILSTYPAECEDKLARSQVLRSQSDLLQQLVAEIGANRPVIQKRFPSVKTTEGRPRLYYWSEQTEEAEVATAEASPAKGGLSTPTVSPALLSPERELDLYPKVTSFMWSEFGVLTKRIDEKRASNRRGPQGNHWLFPDLVGLEDLTLGWEREVQDCVTQAAARKARLWAFEVKLLLNRSNVRECYFQTVSNSSWANFGYLVAADIEGADTLKELRMLAALHGVGVVRLDTENPAESQILIPARERPEVDWANCNRLAAENRDFLDVIKLVRQFLQTGDSRPRDWDHASN